MKTYHIHDIIPELTEPVEYYVGIFEDTPDPNKLDSLQVERLKNAYSDFSPELVKLTLEFGYSDIFSRDNLDPKHRQIATVSALTALGNAKPQLKFHINAGLNIGLTEIEVKEIMLLMSVYAGFPSAINGTNILKEVIGERTTTKRPKKSSQ